MTRESKNRKSEILTLKHQSTSPNSGTHSSFTSYQAALLHWWQADRTQWAGGSNHFRLNGKAHGQKGIENEPNQKSRTFYFLLSTSGKILVQWYREYRAISPKDFCVVWESFFHCFCSPSPGGICKCIASLVRCLLRNKYCFAFGCVEFEVVYLRDL